MAIEKTPTFDSLEDAKAFAAKENESGKYSRAREVYSLSFDKGGNRVTKYLVAQTLIRAHSHTTRVLRDEIGIELKLAESAKRAPRSVKIDEESIKTLTPEQLENVRRMLEQMQQPAAAPAAEEPAVEKPRRGRKAE